jgi:hypothetical protein
MVIIITVHIIDTIIITHIIGTIIITPIVATIITIVAIGDNLRREQQRVPSVTLFEPDLHGRAFLSEPRARPAAILGDELPLQTHSERYGVFVQAGYKFGGPNDTTGAENFGPMFGKAEPQPHRWNGL